MQRGAMLLMVWRSVISEGGWILIVIIVPLVITVVTRSQAVIVQRASLPGDGPMVVMVMITTTTSIGVKLSQALMGLAGVLFIRWHMRGDARTAATASLISTGTCTDMMTTTITSTTALFIRNVRMTVGVGSWRRVLLPMWLIKESRG